jgi:hypothetical protein
VGNIRLAARAVTHRVYLEAAGVVFVLPSLAWTVVGWQRYAAVAAVRAVVSDALKRQAQSSSQPAHDRAHHRTQIRGTACD